MKSSRAGLADAMTNATVRERKGDPMTQVGLEDPQFCLAVYRAQVMSSYRSVQNIHIFYCILFDENSSSTPALMRTPVGTRC